MLEEIQATGDIFFPKRWLDATLGGHSSPEVAETVREFLARRPDYPARLRGKILQSADGLFRAAEVIVFKRSLSAPSTGMSPSTGTLFIVSLSSVSKMPPRWSKRPDSWP